MDPNFAKFRCNGLITVAIYDLLNEKFINSIVHAFELKKIVYKVNQLSIPDSYDENLNEVCASGVHYFLTLEPALNYISWFGKVRQLFKNRHIIEYNENGKKKILD